MLTKTNHESFPALFSSYFKESYNYLVKDYSFIISDKMNPLGIRYLRYLEGRNTLLISNISNGKIHILNVASGDFGSICHHKASVRKIQTYGNLVITSGWDGTVRVTDLIDHSQKLVLTDQWMGRCPYVNVSEDGRFAYAFSYDSDVRPDAANRMRKFCLYTGKLIYVADASTAIYNDRRSGTILLWNNKVYVSSDNGFFRIFDQKTGRLIHEIITGYDYRTMTSLVPHDEKLLVSDWDGRIHLFDLKKQRFESYFQAHQTDILSIRLHPAHPDILYTAGNEGIIRIWELPGFKLLNTTWARHRDLWSMVFINGRLVVGNIDGEIRVYKTGNGHELTYSGRVVLSGDSYVAQTVGSKLFFTNDIGCMEALPVHGENPLSNKESVHILQQSNHLAVLRDLFGVSDTCHEPPAGGLFFPPLLTTSFGDQPTET
jgi:WD40 repeat protein